MSHPFNKFRQSNVERSRVAGLTNGYSGGGVTHKGLAANPTKQRATGGAVMDDEPMARRRASGGRAKKAAVVVNVISGGQPPPAPPPVMAPPEPPPPGAPMLPPGAPPMGIKPPGLAGAGMPPPGMPMRAEGGRIRRAEVTPIVQPKEPPMAEKGLVIKERGYGPPDEYMDGKLLPKKRNGGSVGTKVQHDKGKNDLGDIHRPRVVTFATGGGVVSFKTGGRITSPARGAMGPKLPGGAGGGKGRIRKASDAKRDYHGPQ